MIEFKTIRELYEACLYGDDILKDSIDDVILEGWIRTNRDNGSIGFIELNDGTYFKNAQLVYNKDLKNVEEVSHLLSGSSISIKGHFVLTPNMKQPFEIQVKEIEILGNCEQDYPLQKKRHTFEYLRTIAHLRPRTNTFNAVFRVRSILSMAIHEFFQNQGFVYVHTPLITSTDGEGAGEMFHVVTDEKNPEAFFGKSASLAVTGQLQVEAFCMAFRDVYTFGPTFRAEKSNTTRHAAEFWMIEPEIAFADLEDDMALIEDCIVYCTNYVLENAPEEMAFFDQFISKGIIDRLKSIINSPFKRMTYTEGIEHLKKAVESGHHFENPRIIWGMDLESEHEKYLTEQVVKGPVFLTDYPSDLKAFYMRENDDGKTVAAVDLLVPGIGELVGGSQREERYDVLKEKMEKRHMNLERYKWYMDLRRFGGCKHAGFGIGFERFLMFITGIENIRDVSCFPRTYRNLEY